MRFMSWLFPPFEPDGDQPQGRLRFRRPIPIRMLIPNMITLLALGVGLTAIRLGIEGRFELAVVAVVAAAVLDSLDGRVARLLKSTSRFGAELDSLADFVNFGVAPAVLLYIWSLSALRSVGWIVVLAFAICVGLRLARFNVALDAPKPAWQSNFFVGMPAPASALTLLLPIYISELGIPAVRDWAPVLLVYCALIAFLTVSRIPTFSGKAMGSRVPRYLVLPLFVLAVLFVAVLVSYPWLTLTLGTVAYLVSVPISFYRYRTLETRMAGQAPTCEPADPGSDEPVATNLDGDDPAASKPAGAARAVPRDKLH